MQVSFTGILKGYLSSENSIQVPINKKFAKAKRVEDVFNAEYDFRTYTRNEQKKMILMAKSAIRDYKEPDPERGEEYQKEAGIYRLTARDAIYYCTGSDIEAAKNLQKELDEKRLKGKERQDAVSKFIDERTKDGDNTGFFIMDSSDGKRYDVFAFGESKKGYTFSSNFLEL